jgi:hypothetical protein
MFTLDYNDRTPLGPTQALYQRIQQAGSRDSSVGIATSYGMDGWGSIPDRGKIFLHNVQTSSGTHPASYPKGTRVFIPGGKTAGA